jgi:hypothetical protein
LILENLPLQVGKRGRAKRMIKIGRTEGDCKRAKTGKAGRS